MMGNRFFNWLNLEKGGTRIGIAGANLVRVPADLTTSTHTTDYHDFGSIRILKILKIFYDQKIAP